MLDSAELFPTFGWEKERSTFILAGGIEALTTSIEGAEDRGEEAVQQVKKLEINESGFTMTELLVGTLISLILLGLVARGARM